MLYAAYQAHSDILAPVRALAGVAAHAIGHRGGMPGHGVVRNLTAAYELIARAGLTHARPPFGIGDVTVGNRDVEVREEIAHLTPFGTLLRFRKDIDTEQPRVLLVAPLSGHFATLLRSTVRTMLPEHDVYITDWHYMRDVDRGHGPQDHPAQPRSMTLMAGPIDTRVNPTRVNELANSKPIEWFEQNLIARVPFRHAGAFRKVYPGFVQLAAFMSMNIDRHVRAHRELYDNLRIGELEKAKLTKDFYDEYFAVLDLTAEFYLETVRIVFQEHRLPKGTLEWRGERVEPRAIRRTALLTVEGEKDDICAVGQTVAAHDLCTGLRPYRKRHHMQAGVGHYGVFSGKRWENQIYPLVKNTIRAGDSRERSYLCGDPSYISGREGTHARFHLA
jgi:poly(3-hydroxybutyrate) depolymerase